MQLAIHHKPGTFSERWITYCRDRGVPFKLVNSYAGDIVEQVAGCGAFMWHHSHEDYRDLLFARQLLYSLEQIGVRTFPNWRTCWHFDDKLGQKYLLEALKVPFVPSHVFYTEKEALDWAEATTWPKVFKLRGGAGSANVRLVKTRSQGLKLVRQAFRRGFSPFNRRTHFNECLRKYNEGKGSVYGILKGFGRLFIPTQLARMHSVEKGYVYFQDFIPNNDFDLRVVVIRDRAFAIKRMVRRNDFRASGSGNIVYGREHFSDELIELTFEINRRLGAQCLAADFVLAVDRRHLLTEVSYGFVPSVYRQCEGFWDSAITFHPGPFYPEDWMVDCVSS